MGWGVFPEPYAFRETAGKESGFDVEVLNAVTGKIGCQVAYSEIDIPWVRHLRMVQLGQIDLAAGASWDSGRAEYAYYSFPYRSEYIGIYVRTGESDHYPITRFEDIAEYDFRLGIQSSFVYGYRADALLKKIGENAQVLTKQERNQKKLLRNRIDGYIGYPPEEAIDLKHQNLTGKIMLLPNSMIKTGDVYFLISKKNHTQDFLEAFNNALIEIQSDGTYDAICRKYNYQYELPVW